MALMILACFLSTSFAQEASGNADSLVASSYLVQTGTIPSNGVACYGTHIYLYCNDMAIYIANGDGNIEKLCDTPPVPENAFDMDGDAAKRDALNDTVTYIAANGEGVFGYNTFSGKWGKLDSEGIHWKENLLNFDCITPDADEIPLRVTRSFITSQRLYLLVSDAPDGTYESSYSFFGFDLTTGEGTKYGVDQAVNACYMENDRFLFLRQMGDEYKLSVFEPSNMSLTDLPIDMSQFPTERIVGGLAYAKEDNSIYFVMTDTVFRSVNGAPFTAVAYLQSDSLMCETPGWVLDNGSYGLYVYEDVKLCVPQDELKQVQLICQAGSIPDEAITIFKQKNPDVVFTQINESVTVENLMGMTTTGDDTVDIFMIRADYLYTSLKNKGQLADMSSSSSLASDVEGMPAAIQDILKNKATELVAYPADMSLWRYGIQAELWQETFGQQPYPASFEALLDRWLEWEVTYQDDYSGNEFVEYYDYSYWCELLLKEYVQQNDVPGTLPDLSDPDLRNAYEKLAQINEVRRSNGRSLTEETTDESTQEGSMFANRMYKVMRTPFRPPYESISLAFAEDDEMHIDANLYVYVINPYSKHLSEAISFVEVMTQVEANPHVYYAFHPLKNTPYEDSYFVDKRAELEAAISDMEAQLAKTDDVNEKEGYEQLITEAKADLDFAEKNKWLISEATIKEYRTFDIINYHENSLLIGDMANNIQLTIQKECERYAAGQYSLDEFLDELARKINTIYLEGV